MWGFNSRRWRYWIVGFSKRIGICTILEAELWGIYEGLLAAWSVGSQFLLVESDCLEAINLINNRGAPDVVLSMIHSISALLNRSWCVQFSHIVRDGNHAADWMAKLAPSDDLFCHRQSTASVHVIRHQSALPFVFAFSSKHITHLFFRFSNPQPKNKIVKKYAFLLLLGLKFLASPLEQVYLTIKPTNLTFTMWNFVSKAFTGASRSKTGSLKQSQVSSECSDDDLSLNNQGEERLECPICCEFFNVVENIPYVLWCGHTLCKNCVLGLQRAVLKYPTLPIHLPFFVACPWCNLFSLRVVYKGNIKFPSKNYFLLWMVESMNGDRSKSISSIHRGHPPACSTNRTIDGGNQLRCINTGRTSCAIHRSENSTSSRNQGHLVTGYFSAERLQLSLHCDTFHK
ncbi:hypothetical protein GQ457_09G018920 [Hibiscus cannabinus]